jgi:hypothetical protein
MRGATVLDVFQPVREDDRERYQDVQAKRKGVSAGCR